MGAMLVDHDADTPVDRNGLASLSAEECLHLLRSEVMGRVGVTWDVLPVILPVNYVVHGNGIVLRTAPGTKLCAALSHCVVAFEVDGVDPVRHEGWSVLVRGPAHEVSDELEIAHLRSLPLRPWANDSADHFVIIDIELLSGRRVVR
jgi:nitroimidazol reductase NimA-like FMN-containing flavoprotein (pyridoxamine 5'-phosphate oxidase superfamily)